MSRYQILMKPIALCKGYGRSRGAEYLLELDAADRDQAVTEARKTADAEGFRGYAITKVKEMTQ